MPATGVLKDSKVIVNEPAEAKEIHEMGWYGNLLEDGRLELELVEALLLMERQRLELKEGDNLISLGDFWQRCCTEQRFVPRYTVYRDLRERGLPVRIGFKGSDFRVYDRGAGADSATSVKWIVFADSEDYSCEFAKLGQAIKLAANIRALALWAVVDNDLDVTYYIINTPPV
jgi:tRNA-intron endonuclease